MNPEPNTQEVSARLNDRLVGELSRFFSGRVPAFKELFQNAFRAGAKNLEITVEQQCVSFQDDGDGCPDPQRLLDAGGTGWDEDEVVEPAGLGFFSILGPDLVARVEVASGDWEMTLDPLAVCAKEPSLARHGVGSTPGFRVHVHFKESHPLDRLLQELQRARGWYPYAVVCNGEPLEPESWEPAGALESEVGRVEVRPRPSGSRRARHRAVWEHREVEGSAFSETLKRAAGCDVRLTALVGGYDVLWFVDADSGVRPKLPDRNDLMHDDALDQTAAVLLKRLDEAMLAQAREVAVTWPDEFVRAPSGPPWLTGTLYGRHVVEALGWTLADWTEYHRASVHGDIEGGLHFSMGHGRMFTKSFLAVADGEVAESINLAKAMGAELPFAVAVEGGVEVVVEELREPAQEGSLKLVCLASGIRVGEHRLPFLLEEEEFSEGRVVLACDPDEATAVVTCNGNLAGMDGHMLGQAVIHFLALSHESLLYENCWAECDGEQAWESDKFEEALLEEVSNAFIGGAVAEARQRHHWLLAELDGATRSRRNLRSCEQTRPAAIEATDALDRLVDAISADLVEAKGAARLPA